MVTPPRRRSSQPRSGREPETQAASDETFAEFPDLQLPSRDAWQRGAMTIESRFAAIAADLVARDETVEHGTMQPTLLHPTELPP